MVLKTDESEGKILKICINSKKFLKSLDIMFRDCKHFFGKNYFENQKIPEKFRNIVQSQETFFVKNYFENQKNSEKVRNTVQSLETNFW